MHNYSIETPLRSLGTRRICPHYPIKSYYKGKAYFFTEGFAVQDKHNGKCYITSNDNNEPVPYKTVEDAREAMLTMYNEDMDRYFIELKDR